MKNLNMILKLKLSFLFLFFSFTNYSQFGSEQIILEKEIPAHGHIADINGDGNNDLIVGIHSIDKIVWFNNTNGQGDYDTEYILISTDVDSITSIAGADVDNDGDIDIISSSANDQKIAWYENIDGLGNFGNQNIIAEGIGNATFVTTADIDGDGNIDVLFSSTGSGGQISLYKNIDGLGTFVEEQVIITGNCYNVATSDIDNDGDLDIIIGDSKLRWSENTDGQGAYATPQIIANGKCIYITSADIDSDGYNDLITFQDFSQGDHLSIFKNLNGTGDFDEENVYSNFLKGRTVDAGDFDQDGDIDLISTSWGRVSWHKNVTGSSISGIGSNLNEFVGSSTSSYLTSGYFDVTIDDIDNDGDLDIIGFTGASQNIHTFHKNNSSATFQENHFDATAYVSGGIRSLVDIDADGDLDILGTSAKGYSSNDYDKIVWIENIDGVGEYGYPQLIYFDNSKIKSLTSANLDNDGNPDIIFNDFQKVYWMKSIDGLGNFESPLEINSIANSRTYPIDLDLDGDVDIFTFKNDTIGWYTNIDGLGNFSQINIIAENGVNPYGAFFLEDVDGDNDKDIIVTLNFSDDFGWFENLDGVGNFSDLQILINGIEHGRIRLGDMDNDGDKDIVSFEQTGNIFWYPNEDGLWNFGDEINIAEPIDGSLSIDVYDLDNDLDLDILAIDRENFELVWYENLNNSFTSKKIIHGNWDLFSNTLAGDIDNDGYKDILTGSVNNGKISWNKNFIGNTQIIVNCFFDENENGIFDSNEERLFDQQVELQQLAINHWTNGAGQILYHLDLGNYNFNYTPPSNWETTTNSQIMISVTNLNEEQEVNFGIKPINLTSETTAELYAIGATRCGFTIPFALGYANTGSSINSGFVSLKLDPLVTYQFAEPAPDSIFQNTLFWNYENLYPFEVRGVYLNLVMPTVDFIGEQISMDVSSFVVNGMDTVLSKTNVFESIINCSYDPNDKRVKPDLVGEENYALFGEYLEYTIRFQNTGTDTAFTIRIDDYLDSNLDWTTFDPIFASHDYEVSLNDGGKLTYLFENILLPDSTTNEIDSHGFFSYRIKPKSDIPENTVIENTAKIFFDYNPAIITNTVQNTLVPIMVSFEENNNSCFGDQNGSISINEIFAVEPFNFLWNNGSTNSSIIDLEGGSYSLTITDGNNSIFEYGFDIETPTEVNSNIESTPEINGNINGTVSVVPTGGTAPYSYLWNTNPSQNSETVEGLNAGLYFITITDAFSCTKVDSIEVESITGINETEILNRFFVFPNPSNSDVQINIDLNQVTDFVLKINSVTGQKVKEFEFTEQINVEKTIGIEVLPKGIYFIRLEIDGMNFIKKIVIF
jgi:uncharacterized repeat protein (TIGR01451 family)